MTSKTPCRASHQIPPPAFPFLISVAMYWILCSNLFKFNLIVRCFWLCGLIFSGWGCHHKSQPYPSQLPNLCQTTAELASKYFSLPVVLTWTNGYYNMFRYQWIGYNFLRMNSWSQGFTLYSVFCIHYRQ